MKILLFFTIVLLIFIVVYVVFSLDLNPEVFTGASLV